jgi:hypothetical protein
MNAHARCSGYIHAGDPAIVAAAAVSAALSMPRAYVLPGPTQPQPPSPPSRATPSKELFADGSDDDGRFSPYRGAGAASDAGSATAAAATAVTSSSSVGGGASKAPAKPRGFALPGLAAVPSSSSSPAPPPSRATGGLFDDDNTDNNPEQDSGGFPGFSAVSPPSMPSPPPIKAAAAASTSTSLSRVAVSPRTKGLFDDDDDEEETPAVVAPAGGGVRAQGGQLNLTAAMLRNEVSPTLHRPLESHDDSEPSVVQPWSYVLVCRRTPFLGTGVCTQAIAPGMACARTPADQKHLELLIR